MNFSEGLSTLFHKFYILNFYRRVGLICGIAIVFTVFLILLLKKKLTVKQTLIGGFLTLFVFLVVSSALLTRIPTWHFVETWKAREFKYILIPFYSYYQVFAKGYKYLLMDKFFNTLMLMPVGALLPTISKKVTPKQLFFISLIISGTIEIGQLCLKCGTFETDDLIHNIAGCLFGFLIYKAVTEFYNDFKKR